MRAFVGLGSNLGDRFSHMKSAVAMMKSRELEVISVSSVYETDPVGPPQPDFLNAACEIETGLSARDLLSCLKEIEQSLGRTKGDRWGPREIDLDLLLYGDQTIAEDDLTVPHPELTHRAFMMVPLLELDPDLELPSGEPLSTYCEKEHPAVRFFGHLDE